MKYVWKSINGCNFRIQVTATLFADPLCGVKVYTLNSAYNEVAFNEKSAITKENLCTKYTPFTYKYIALNEKPPITKQSLRIFFFVIGGDECMYQILSHCDQPHT